MPILVTLMNGCDKLAVWQKAFDLGLVDRYVVLYNKIAVDCIQDIHEQDDAFIDNLFLLLKKRVDNAHWIKFRIIQKIDNNEIFCFVAFGVDLEESTYQGLRFFWSRLSPRGYIFCA